MNSSYTIPVSHTSYETMQEAGYEVHDNGFTSNNYYSLLVARGLLKVLTRKQQKIVAELAVGKSRKEIANMLIVSEQAIHQIIPRIRKRLHDKAGVSKRGWKRKHGGY